MTGSGGGMDWREPVYVGLGLLSIFCLVAPVVLIARLSRLAGLVVAALWFFVPVAIYWAAIGVEFAMAPGDEATNMANAWAGFHLVSAMATVPWLIMWSGGIVLALALRRQSSQRSAAGRTAPAMAEPPSPSASPPPPSSQHTPPRVLEEATHSLHDTIRARAAEFGIEERVLPIVYFPDNDAVYVNVTDYGYSMARYDRGREHDVSTTRSLDEILYWVFDEATFRLAAEQAAREITHADQFGPLVLAHQDRLLARIHADWHARWQVDPTRRAAYYRDRLTR